MVSSAAYELVPGMVFVMNCEMKYVVFTAALIMRVLAF